MNRDDVNMDTSNLTTENISKFLVSCGTVGIRTPYTAPRVHVTHPTIQGGDTTHVAESQGGLWTS